MIKNRYEIFVLALLGLAIITTAGCSADENTKATHSDIVCTTNDECPIGQNCIQGKCLPEGTILCETDYDCPIGTFCENGVCSNLYNQQDGDTVDTDKYEIDTIDAVEEQDQTDIAPNNLCKPCNTDSDCEGSQNFCIEDQSGQKYCFMFCQNTIDCPQGYICRHFDFGNQCYPQDGFCESTCIDTGCEDGKVCNPENGQCEEVQHGTQGFCDPCNSDADCQEGGKCIPDSSGNTFCGTDCTNSPCEIPNTYCKYIDSNTKQCWPVNNTCNPACDCSMVNCPEHTQCNPANCNCEPGPDHCANTGCPAGQQCDYNSGNCTQSAQNCCQNPSICTNVGMVCDYNTCQCTNQSGGRCTSNTNCNAGEVCTIDGTCQQAYCLPCADIYDCPMTLGLFDDVKCENGYCLPSCFTDLNCPSGSHCESGSSILYAYCVPNSGSCNGSSSDGDIDAEEENDPCGGVTYEGECRDGVLYWCEDNTLKQQNCENYNAVCAQWPTSEGGDDGFFCRGVEGGTCGGTKPACMPNYQCVNDICTSQSSDGDVDSTDSSDTEDTSIDYPDEAEEYDIVDETTETDVSDSSDIAEETSGTGGVGDPCPDGYSTNCNQSITDTCLTDGNTNQTYCSKTCSTDTECNTAASNWCCAPIGSGRLYCIPPDYCSNVNHSGVCSDPIIISSLPFTETNTVSGSSNFEDSNEKCGLIWGAIGPEKIYALNLNANDTVRITVTSNIDIILYMADRCTDDDINTCIGADDYIGNESLEIVVHNSTTYYIIVDTYSASASGEFTINVEKITE